MVWKNGDWDLGIGDRGLGIGPNPQSPIPNPQSPIPNPHKLKLNELNILKNKLFQIIIKKLKNNKKFNIS